ncbi:MAG TPA: 3-phenylpropionate/cinnamic acid dioxygenase subunit beta [Pseudomonas xinjiangensis]|uniref:3-phenylpropionate/cinnamic acid dioxygenase subunit beta n=2 Tax=root TaxID=1 RepID=A0A7V1FTI4_9GAMM|nr:3-phenylpropionate/cinnamic acid dioxygenase subunit beta [Halopseudomonas xinjiangensis]HEC49038.1 3-phenylpropionate/cinnamic acid dioxygenase subunit beta [Halopseudomonas xinjiangensis]
MQQVQEKSAEAPQGQAVPVGSAEYNAILTFLYEEAALLDQLRLSEWGERLATDLVYTAPLRHTRLGVDHAKSFVRSVMHFHDDYRSVMGRILRLSGKSAWAEDPPSRTRRLVTNVLVRETAKSDEFEVVSYLLMTRSRFSESHVDVISCERRDVIRREADGTFKLAKREALLDQSVLGTANLAVFL